MLLFETSETLRVLAKNFDQAAVQKAAKTRVFATFCFKTSEKHRVLAKNSTRSFAKSG